MLDMKKLIFRDVVRHRGKVYTPTEGTTQSSYPVRLSIFQEPLNPFNGFHFPPQRWNFDQKYANQRPKFSKDALQNVT
jgi:hypothetical protein